jgi:thiol-disulfide isomerase/thioredoxin
VWDESSQEGSHGENCGDRVHESDLSNLWAAYERQVTSYPVPVRVSVRQAVLLVALLVAVGVATTLVVVAGRPSSPRAPATGWLTFSSAPRVALPSYAPISGTPPADPPRVVLLNVWASTCVPCRRELPMLESLAGGSGIAVVGVSRDVDADHALRSVSEYGLTYANWLDPDGRYTASFADLVPPAYVPSTLVLVDGRAVAARLGALPSASEVRAEVARVTSAS